MERKLQTICFPKMEWYFQLIISLFSRVQRLRAIQNVRLKWIIVRLKSFKFLFKPFSYFRFIFANSYQEPNKMEFMDLIELPKIIWVFYENLSEFPIHSINNFNELFLKKYWMNHESEMKIYNSKSSSKFSQQQKITQSILGRNFKSILSTWLFGNYKSIP